MTDEHNEEQKEKNKKVAEFPSENDLTSWQSAKEETEADQQAEKVTTEEATASEASKRLAATPKTTQSKKTTADYLLQNQKQDKESVHSSSERVSNRQNWEHYTKTTQTRATYNRFPTYFYAGFWIRSFAFLVDLVCIKLVTSILLDGLGGASALLSAPTVHRGLSLVIYLLYFMLLTKITNGQTIGKMIFGIQVVCFTEERLSWATVIVREGACRFVLQLSFLVLGYGLSAFSTYKQHPGDFISDTSVVTLNQIKAYNGLEA